MCIGYGLYRLIQNDYISHMTKNVSVSLLKARLSQYLDAIQGGEEIIVTDRGKPIARLAPIRGTTALAARMEELLRNGRVRPPTKEFDAEFWDLPRPEDPKGLALRALIEERRGGR